MLTKKDFEDEQKIKELQKKVDKIRLDYETAIKELRGLIYKIEHN